MFKQRARIKKNKQQVRDTKEYNQIHWYIINNDLQKRPEQKPYILLMLFLNTFSKK